MPALFWCFASPFSQSVKLNCGPGSFRPEFSKSLKIFPGFIVRAVSGAAQQEYRPGRLPGKVN
jgi:hypothetical protein